MMKRWRELFVHSSTQQTSVAYSLSARLCAGAGGTKENVTDEAATVLMEPTYGRPAL